MSFQDCIDEITKAAGRPLNDDELEAVQEALQAALEVQKATKRLDDLETVMANEGAKLSDDIKLAAMENKKNTLINIIRESGADEFMKNATELTGDAGLALEGLIVGINNPVKGGRNSAAANQLQLERQYIGGLYAGLRREAARECDATRPSFQVRNPFLEGGDRRIHDPRVGIAVLLKVEVGGRCVGILEDVARGLEDGHRASARGRVGPLPGMNRPGVEAERLRLVAGRVR